MMLLAQPSHSDAGVVQVLASDNPLTIRGKVGDENSFVRKVGLFAHEQVQLLFRPTDLQWTGHNVQIGHPQVVATGDTKLELQRNVLQEFEIKATGIKIPGTYKGKLHFFQPAGGMNPALEVPLTVIAESVPKLSQRKGSESVKIQLVNCGPRSFLDRQWACLLGAWGWLQPDAFPSMYPLQFDNDSLEQFHMTASVTAIGDSTRESLDQTLKVEPDVTVPLGNVYTLPINIDAAKPLPDHYVGDVQLRLLGQDTSLRIPLEANVRTGPTLSAVVLLIGILIGRLSKQMDKGSQQSDLLRSLDRLKTRSESLPAVQNQQPGDALEDVRPRIHGMQLSQARLDLIDIERRWLQGQARALHPFVRMMSALTGHSVVLDSELPAWAIRTLLYVLLIGVLVFLGLQQLYVKNLTFGSNPVSDYVGMLIWATSSDVASRTVSTLRSSGT